LGMCLVPPPPYSYNSQGQGLYVPCSNFQMDDAIVGVGSHIPFGNGGGQLTSHFTRVEWPMSEHLNVQGRPDLRAGLCCFWYPNTT